MVHQKALCSPIKAAMVCSHSGLFGVVINGLLLIPFYYLPSMTPFSNDPQNKLENSLDGFTQMSNNPLIIVAIIGRSANQQMSVYINKVFEDLCMISNNS